MASGKPLSIVVVAFYFAVSAALGIMSALYGIVTVPGFPGFAFLFAGTFAFAVAKAACCYGLWTKQSWARTIAFGVIAASIVYGVFHNLLLPEPQWLLFAMMTLVSLAAIAILDTIEARSHFGLSSKPGKLGIAIPGEFDFRARLMERNAE